MAVPIERPRAPSAANPFPTLYDPVAPRLAAPGPRGLCLLVRCREAAVAEATTQELARSLAAGGQRPVRFPENLARALAGECAPDPPGALHTDCLLATCELIVRAGAVALLLTPGPSGAAAEVVRRAPEWFVTVDLTTATPAERRPEVPTMYRAFRGGQLIEARVSDTDPAPIPSIRVDLERFTPQEAAELIVEALEQNLCLPDLLARSVGAGT